METQKTRLEWLPAGGLIGILFGITLIGFLSSHYVVQAFGGTTRYTFLHDYLDQPYLGWGLLIWLIAGQIGALLTLRLRRGYITAVKQMVVGIAALLVLITMAQWAYMLVSDAYALRRTQSDWGSIREHFGFAMFFLALASPLTLVFALIKPVQKPL
ncbi:MAG: hypothetical protein EA374_05940 [Acholeplasmatales bacterium]|nr:MAG: hypothetical protein EA374_05940 [Acholeplasmatales bacterium]